ncbi:MAG TPA: flagellar hook-basal body complex protein FliE [Myxococcales bacterium]|jgi:flagellar hook-basal body complex protein FliE|nr:flagellar hook-basal body complex protein FliE [Myxococcales bacterium]
MSVSVEGSFIPVVPSPADQREIFKNGGAADDADFSGEMLKAIGAVDKLQLQADAQATQLANGGGNLHETALALEKAEVAMHVATKARNKVVDAYQEIMRMSV